MTTDVFISEDCINTANSLTAGHCDCRENECVLTKASIIRERDFGLLLDQQKAADNGQGMSIFVCSTNDFERLARGRKASSIGALVQLGFLEGNDRCKNLNRCMEVARRRRTFISIWNLALVDKRVCVTLSQDRKLSWIHKQIRWMGGFVERSMNDSVTHLVCDSSSSEAYKAAVARGFRSILTYNWLIKCWMTGDSSINETWTFKVFSGLSFCLSGYPVEELVAMEKQIANNGGRVVSNCHKCTHLVLYDANEVPSSVPDHIFAVNHTWLKSCLTSQIRVDENLHYLNANVLNASLASCSSRRSTETPRKRGFLTVLNTVLSPRHSILVQSETKRRRSSRRSVSATHEFSSRKIAIAAHFLL
ncbi:hypothetical protein ACOME3_004980 [Neoechinorhynchus agilis]